MGQRAKVQRFLSVGLLSFPQHRMICWRGSEEEMQDKLHQPYRKTLIPDYEAIESLVRTTGAGFCLSGAGPTLLCITRDKKLEEKLSQKLDSITEANWEMIPLHVEFQGAHVIATE